MAVNIKEWSLTGATGTFTLSSRTTRLWNFRWCTLNSSNNAIYTYCIPTYLNYHNLIKWWQHLLHLQSRCFFFGPITSSVVALQTDFAKPWPAMLCLAATTRSIILCPDIILFYVILKYFHLDKRAKHDPVRSKMPYRWPGKGWMKQPIIQDGVAEYINYHVTGIIHYPNKWYT